MELDFTRLFDDEPTPTTESEDPRTFLYTPQNKQRSDAARRRTVDELSRDTPERTETPLEAPPPPYPIQNTPSPQNAAESPLDPLQSKQAIETALKVLERNKQSREATEGIMQQLELDITKHKNPCTLLLYAAEALDRLSGHGDGYIQRIERALTENGYLTESDPTIRAEGAAAEGSGNLLP